MNKVLKIEDFKEIEPMIERKFGDQLIIGYMKGDECHTYISPKITDVNECYIIDNLKQRRLKSYVEQET